MNHAGDPWDVAASASAHDEPPERVSGDGNTVSTALGSSHEPAATGALKHSCL